MSRLLWLFSTLLACTAVCYGQATGTIQGTITDASGAAVPDARVVATNLGTNLTRTMNTAADGKYVLPLLPTGQYEISVEKDGFQRFRQANVTLQANTNVQVDARLQIAAAAESITVSDAAAMVQASSSTLVQVVDRRRIEELPLNGRNVLQLMTLNAGIVDRGAGGNFRQINTVGGGGYAIPVSINGSRGNATNYLLDNNSNNDLYTNISEPYPNPDAVQEVSIQTSSFDAQFGRGVGGVVNVTTKSGTNQFHGSAFNFLRNFKMNAANTFTGRDALKRNQFGGTLGGPVLLPRLYNGRDKTFFFFGYQGTRQRVATPGVLRTAPSDAMKQGDFSSWLRPDGTGRIRDPLAPTTYFPENRIPVSRFDPVSRRILEFIPSSADPTYQLRFGTPSNIEDDDQWVVRGDHHFNERQRLTLRYFLLKYDRPWITIPGNLLYVVTGQFANAHNATINHTSTLTPSALNELGITFHRSTPRAEPSAQLAGVSFDQFGSRMQSVRGFPTMDVGISNWSGIGIGLGYYAPQTTLMVQDNVNWIRGKHNMRFGGEVRFYLLDIASYWLSGGVASFNGQMLSDPGRANAGNAFAEFLLGRGASWRQQSFSSWTLRNRFPAMYFQDDFRVSSRLTLNLGVRWDPKWDYTEDQRKRATFMPGLQSRVYPNAPRGLVFLGDAGLENTIIQPDRNNLAPRFGFAYQLRPKTVVRGAYGIFFDQLASILNNRTAQGEPFVRQANFVGPFQLSDPYAGGPVLDPSPIIPGPEFRFNRFGTWALPARDIPTGYMQQLSHDFLLRAAYVASKGTKLINAIEVNPALYGPGATAANINERRIYADIGGLQLANAGGKSSYQSMQLTLQKRYARSFSVLANYTWAHSIDVASNGSIDGNYGGPNPFNQNDNLGDSDFDLRHRLVASGIVDHPALRGQPALVRHLLGGWQSNFIFVAESGPPMTVFSGLDNALSGVGGQWADYDGRDWRLSGSRSRGEKIARWFDTSAFTVNAPGTFGTGRRNQLRGPGVWNVDYSAFKNVPFHDRMTLQIRGEFFNLFNTVRLSPPTTTVTSPLFGRITSAGAPRIVQIALRLSF